MSKLASERLKLDNRELTIYKLIMNSINTTYESSDTDKVKQQVTLLMDKGSTGSPFRTLKAGNNLIFSIHLWLLLNEDSCEMH